MRTSDRLPEECREEIRAKLTYLHRMEDIYIEGRMPREQEHKESQIHALAWVLGEDDQ